ncbi:MAG: hypothetical protein OEV06_04945, partial [Anaerolineae bacterium]|nr:hypothetical protein [Anaerolineae bacterium]
VFEGEGAGGEFVKDDAEGVEISTLVNLSTHGLFGRHVEHGTNDGAVDGHSGGDGTGKTEIHEFDSAVGIDHEIFGLEITVDDALFVGMLEGGANLAGNGHDGVQVLGRLLVKGISSDQLHDNEWSAIDFAGIENGDNIGVIELGNELGFMEKAGLALGAKLEVGEDLDSDVAVEGLIMGAIDGAHATLAELGLDLVAIV